MSKSAMIRELYQQGKNLSEISQELNIRYQFVYNVVSRLCAKTGEPIRKIKEKSTSQIIREMFDEGKTPGQISKELNLNYVFVYQVVKKYKGQVKSEVTDQK